MMGLDEDIEQELIEKLRKLAKDEDLALGSERWHFGTICKDCQLPRNGNVGLRQAYFYPDKSAGLQTITRWKCGGGKEVVHVYPTKCLDYCYYHAKKRGLLPWQN